MLSKTQTQSRTASPDRSTASLEKIIADRIASRIGRRIRKLFVEVHGKTVRIGGECSTYYSKQLAQHVALGVIEDEHVVNEIAVKLPG